MFEYLLNVFKKVQNKKEIQEEVEKEGQYLQL